MAVKRRPRTREEKPSPRASNAETWTTVVLTAIGAILVRHWFPRAWGELYSPASAFYEGDARAYLNYAAHLVKGIPFDNGVPFHPPGWPFVLSLFFRLAGFNPIDGVPVDQRAVKGFVAMISGLSVGLTALVAARVWGRGAMLAAALLGTFSFAHVVQGSVPNADALYGLLLVATVLLAWRWISGEPSPRLGAMLGALTGFATLVRPEFALCAVLFGIATMRSGPRRDRANVWSDKVRGLSAYAIAFVLTLTPTTIWHWQSISTFNDTRADRLPGPLPRFAPVTSYGAFNFANANHERAPGGFNFDSPALRPQTPEEERQFDEGYLDLALPSVYDVYVHGYSIGARWMANHPGAALALLGRKAAITSGVFAHGYLQTNVGSSLDGIRRTVDEVDPSARWLLPVHMGLVLWGAWLVVRRRGPEAQRRRWVLFAPLASLGAASLLFYGYVRLGAAYLPIFWILQAIAIAAIASRLPVPHVARTRTSLLLLAFSICLLTVEAIGATARRTVVLEGSTAPDGSLVQDATVIVKRSR